MPSLGNTAPEAARFEKLGISFQYPTNWRLDESEALDGYESVTVYSPGGAFWSVTIHPRGLRPGELVDAALTAMTQEYDELDAEEAHETVGGHDLVGCDMNFYCLDLTNTAQVRAFSNYHASYMILCQADDREFTEVEAVFRAITASLLAGFEAD